MDTVCSDTKKTLMMESMADTLEDALKVLKAMNQSPEHAASWVYPKGNGADKLINKIQYVLNEYEDLPY
jgi:hypothetical protein